MIIMKKSKLLLAVAALALCGLSNAVHAENIDLPTVKNADAQNSDTLIETHEAIKLTMDKSELIHLEDEIGSIIIGSPTHLNVLADSAHTLVVIPRKAGASHFSVLDKTGKLLMQRHVIIAAPTEGYVRIKRTCTDDNCKDTSTYYCPEMCHEIEEAEEN